MKINCVFISGVSLERVRYKWIVSSPNFSASDLGMLVVAVGRVMEVAGLPPPAGVVAARLWMDNW